MTLRFLAVAAAALVLALPALAQYPAARGQRAAAAKATAQPQLRLGIAHAAASATLPPVSDAEVEAVRSHNRAGAKGAGRDQLQRIAVGIARPLARAALEKITWTAVPGGHAAQLAVTSPDAGSLRLAIDLAGVPLDVQMVFFGSANPARLEGPVSVGEIADRTGAWWSPLTEGETQTVEFFVPAGEDPARVRPAIGSASHVFTTPSTRFTKRLQDIGSAGACNVDLPCSPLAGNAAFRDAADSVAQMIFVDTGITYLCTGTLLADGDGTTQVPWFYSANHCFENENPPYKTAAQMQVVANTLTTLWGFQASACKSFTPRADWSQLTGGATRIYNDQPSDVLFLRLAKAPPSLAFYSGWDSTPLSVGAALTALHDPQGDLEKVSQGSVVRFSSPGSLGGSTSFIEVLWSSGTTEAGSSGGGIWTSIGGQYAFRGALWGGSALCSNPSGTDFFSRFDQAYPKLAGYLGTKAATLTDYTDLWWNPSESGWGLNLVQHDSRAIFGVWYTYDLAGDRTWFVMPSGSWTSATTYTGALYATSGPAYNGPFDPAQVDMRQVGTFTLTFSDANNGTFAYSVDGVGGVKSITRQSF